MTNLPAELQGFPHHLLDSLRDGSLQEPDLVQRRRWMDQLYSWLTTLGSLASQAHGLYKDKKIATERAWARIYKASRVIEKSVAGAEKAADTSDEYLDALEEEYKAENRWKIMDIIHSDTLEVIQASKKSMEFMSTEMKYLGRQT